jgi:energy-coupling factor transport system ATP-binding protein
VLADLSLALCLLSRFVPFGGALVAFGTVPIATVASRHRVRAALVGGLAAVLVGFLLAGFDMVLTVGACTALGALSGCAHRRGWGLFTTVGLGVVAFGLPGAAAALLILQMFADLRRLTLASLTNTWSGLSHTLRDLGLNGLAGAGDTVTSWLTANWWVVVILAVLALVVVGCTLSWLVGHRILNAFDGPREDHAPTPDVGAGVVPEPVPVDLVDVTVRYPTRNEPALSDVTMSLGTGELVAVVGENGSGKSTLTRVLVGRAPTSGRVLRPGSAGLGAPRGSAVVFQRPEAQVLGVRVSDDLRWGLRPDDHLDVGRALDTVGLSGFADRETSTLSGGELQRLAIASARVRDPQLLVSDEATSMLDPAGRREVMELLRRTASDGVTVVHVTHDRHEAAIADRIVQLRDGRIITTSEPVRAPTTRVEEPITVRRARLGHLSFRGVGHVYSARTPWAHRSLEPLDLEIGPGEGVVVGGHNGSGKSTLAWIAAGLVVPTEGRVFLDGRPADRQVGRVGLSFQHPRLQLLAPIVEQELCESAGVDQDAAHDALRRVGLPPEAFASRRVDRLSGGEQRRLVVASLLARRAPVVILDEPFAGLDGEGRALLLASLRALRATTGATLLVISHEEGLPTGVAERFVRLDRGRVVEDRVEAARP